MLVWKIWARLTSDAPQGAVPSDPVAKSIQDQAKGQGRQPAGKGVKARPGFRFKERQKNMK